LEEISAYLSSFLLAAASAAEPAQEDVVLRYEAATSVTFTSQVAQRPSFHGVSVRPSGRLPSALKRSCGSLIEENPALEKVNARSGHSQSNGAVIDPDFICARAHESHECRLRTHKCIGMVDKAPNPAGGPQHLSKLRCSGGVRMLILELRGANRHCALLLRQEV